MRARRERGGVGKGARGVVQFRVGITLDFRGDVATSPALSFPSPSLHLFAALLLLLFLHLQRPPNSLPFSLSLPLPITRISVSCVLPFQRAKATHPSYYREHPDYLGEIDPSAHATLYTVHGTKHIASDDISPFLAFGLDVAVQRDGRPHERGRALRHGRTFSPFEISPIVSTRI